MSFFYQALLLRFSYPLPSDVLPEGKHHILVDASDQYFGMNAQKRSQFVNQALLTSERTKQINLTNARADKEKEKISRLFVDDIARELACKKMLLEFEERRLVKMDEAQKKIKDSEDAEELMRNDDGNFAQGTDGAQGTDRESDDGQ